MVAPVLHLDKSPRMALEPVRNLPRRLRDSHNIRHLNPCLARAVLGQSGPGRGFRLLRIPDNGRNFGEAREFFRLDLCRTSRHHNPRVGSLALQPPDCLPRLTHRLGSHSTTIHNDEIIMPRLERCLFHRLRLNHIEPTAKCDKINTHHETVSKSDAPSVPRCSSSTGPVIST